MAIEFDPRVIQIAIDIDGKTETFEGLYITAQGTRYGTDVSNECQVRIDNMTRANRDYILNHTSPYKQFSPNPRVNMTVKAGRKSYGPSLLYVGYVMKSTITQPPDIGIILQCLTGLDQTTNIISYGAGPQISLKSLSQKAAQDLGLTLNFQATDKTISNFNLSGTALLYVQKLAQTGNVDVTIDNQTLIVKDAAKPINAPIKQINQSTGMIGIPEITDSGIRVKFLLDNDTQLFQSVNITSVLNPAVNGIYQIFKLGFDIATRDTPFYYIADCQQLKVPV